MKKIAILVCLALLVSLFAVNVSAATTEVTSTFDFKTLTPADPGAASNAAMESLGVTVEGNWWVQDCYHVFATPQDGYQTCSITQVLDLGDKVLLEDATVTAGFWLAAVGDPSWFWIEYSTDGENWTELYEDVTGFGEEWVDSAYAEGTLPLTGTAGASKVYVKYYVERHSGQTSGGVTFGTIKGVVEGEAEVEELPENTVQSNLDVKTLTPADPGAASNTALEGMGFEVSGNWWVQDCFHVFATPQDGYQTCTLTQKLEAGEGKVFDGDVSLTAGYWLAAVGDPSWFWIEVSTDGENWTELYVDEAGRGAEWDASAYTEGTLPITGTDGKSVVYVKYNVERHSGQTSGGLTFSTITGNVKDAAQPDPSLPKTGDTIGVIVALFAVCAAGIVLTSKKIKNI